MLLSSWGSIWHRSRTEDFSAYPGWLKEGEAPIEQQDFLDQVACLSLYDSTIHRAMDSAQGHR